MLKDVDQGRKGVPMPVGTVMEQLLALADLEIQLLHPAAMFFELLAITPAVSGMVFEVVFEVFHQPRLRQHLARQVVLRRGHVVPLGHMGHRQRQTTTGLIPMAQLTTPA